MCDRGGGRCVTGEEVGRGGNHQIPLHVQSCTY